MRAFFFILPLLLGAAVLPLPADALVQDCALERPSEAAELYCDDTNDLVLQIIRIGQFLLGLTGSLALVMFIYGGFVFLTAMGRSEQAKKGQQVIGAAVIGLIITLSAYFIIDFVVQGLGVGEYFTGSSGNTTNGNS